MTPVELIASEGRLEAAISGDYTYLYITVSGLGPTELDSLLRTFGGAHHTYNTVHGEVLRWKASNVNTLQLVVAALDSSGLCESELAQSMLNCLEIYALSDRGERSEIARRVREMMGRPSISLSRVVGSSSVRQLPSACEPSTHPSS